MADILILTEAGDNIGYGHLSRCSAILDGLKKKKIKAYILVQWNGLKPSLYNYSICNWREKKGLDKYMNASFNILIDSYKANKKHFLWLKNHFRCLTAIDDYGRLSDYSVDLIINPNIFGNQIHYKSKSIGGADYVILRKAFREGYLKNKIRNNISNILVTVGGSDYRKLLPRLMNGLKALPYNFFILCGNDNYAQTLSEKYKLYNHFKFFGLLDEDEVKKIMLNSDIAISGCGQTLHELAFLGIPIIGICIDKDQINNRNSYMKNGIIHKIINWNTSDLLSIIINEIINLSSFQKRNNIHNKSIKLIDGLGVNRIIDSLQL